MIEISGACAQLRGTREDRHLLVLSKLGFKVLKFFKRAIELTFY
jgi:hypothetical protein